MKYFGQRGVCVRRGRGRGKGGGAKYYYKEQKTVDKTNWSTEIITRSQKIASLTV